MNKSPNTVIFSFIFFGSIALHASMFATGYMQEDAFIIFRVAFNLADYGIYSFNLDENYTGITSLFYGFFVAVVRSVFNDYAILIISFINIIFSLAGGYFLFLSFKRISLFSKIHQNTSFAIILLSATTSPALLKISSSGMETAVFFLVLCVTLWALSINRLIILNLCLVTLPFIRIDSIGFCFIVIICLFFANRRQAFVSTLLFVLGFGLLIITNKLVFDFFLPNTLEAKAIAYNPDKTISAITSRYLRLMFVDSFLLGVWTKYIHHFIYILTAVAFLYPVLITIKHFYKNILPRNLFNKNENSSFTKKMSIYQNNLPIYVISFTTILIPLAYATGGVIFPWYLWPFSSLTFVLFTCFVINRFNNTLTKLFYIIFISGLALLNIFININIGEQDNRFRASIGNHIKQIASPTDTLFLEPAGYIPFFAGIKTFDTIGLASPRIINYRIEHQNHWWINFVMDETPTFIIDRMPIHLLKITGDGIYKLSDEQYKWFMNSYVLEASFNYNEYLEKNKTSLYSIYKLGSSANYFLYKKIF